MLYVPARSAARDLLHLVGLDHIAFLDVVEALDDQTALEALADLRGVVLLALQGRQVGTLDDHCAVADDTHLGVAPDHAAGDHAAGDVADLGGPEDRPDL